MADPNAIPGLDEAERHAFKTWTDYFQKQLTVPVAMSVTAAAVRSLLAERSALETNYAAFRAQSDERIAALQDECAKLKRFKEYVHTRLDNAGVPTDPESPHKAEGCRIGGRLDALFVNYYALIELAKFAESAFCDPHSLDTDPAARTLKTMFDKVFINPPRTPAEGGAV